MQGMVIRMNTMNNELYHYGVKGMKWGVRRYQNKDGTLTRAGKAKIREIYSYRNQISSDKKWSSVEEDNKRKAGIVDKRDVDFIKEGSTLKRLSDNKSETMNRRKYVYITKGDDSPYKNMAKSGYLGTKNTDTIYEYRLKARYDLKVATGEQVAKHIISKYGDKKLKHAYKEYTDLNIRDNFNKIDLLSNRKSDNKIPQNIDEKTNEYRNETWAGNYANKVKNDTYDGFNKLLYQNEKINSEVCDHYAKKGYDAIIDIEDYIGGFEYPIILLDPKKSVRVESVRKI